MKKLKRYGKIGSLSFVIVAVTLIFFCVQAGRVVQVETPPPKSQSNAAQRSFHGGIEAKNIKLNNGDLLFPYPDYIENDILSDAIYSSMKEVHDWIPKYFFNASVYSFRVFHTSNRYFSMQLTFTFSGIERMSKDIFHTLDLQSGNSLYLDDIVDITELENMLFEQNIAYFENSEAAQQDAEYTLIYVNEHQKTILKNLSFCAVPYNNNNYEHKPAFYLKDDKIYFINVAPSSGKMKFYVNLQDIQHILKIDIPLSEYD